ncbi:MAG: class I SAM-dependent methyltransferase family protein [Candidatus Thermoplasmatota archaeon]|nr:class I SAM-dependent methyltransferase family protein [Candidatus Thermoplasmatota archaeon]
MKKSYAIKVPIKYAKKTKVIIKLNNIQNKNLKLRKDKKFIYYPIKELDNNKLIKFKKVKYIEIMLTSFEEQEKKIQSYKENLKLPDNLKKHLPTSYDIIGKIALIKLPTQLLKYKKNIGISILKSKKNIETVCLVKPVEGELRTRDIQIIAGKKQTKTIHKEFGLTFFVDVKNTYFSPRLANERKRVASLVKPGEIVVDMFTGIAPFAVMIAKYSKAKIIYAVDKNKKAISLAEQNVKINKVIDKITLFNDDSKNIKKILEKEQVFADRIIMNLPFSAHDFFIYALDIISENCIIHYYTIIKEDEIEDKIKDLKKIAKVKNVFITRYNTNKIKSYSPREFYMGIDITVKK